MRMGIWCLSYQQSHQFPATFRTHAHVRNVPEQLFASVVFLALLVVSIANAKQVRTVKILRNNFILRLFIWSHFSSFSFSFRFLIKLIFMKMIFLWVWKFWLPNENISNDSSWFLILRFWFNVLYIDNWWFVISELWYKINFIAWAINPIFRGNGFVLVVQVVVRMLFMIFMLEWYFWL